MNAITHTPGPWYVSNADEWRMASGAHAQFGRFDVSAGSCNLSSENYYRVCSVSNVNNERQNVANARLIAASPDLLKALRKAAVCLAAVCNHAPELGAEDAYSAVDAAIAKATGQDGGAA